jgi:hypothetical protein
MYIDRNQSRRKIVSIDLTKPLRPYIPPKSGQRSTYKAKSHVTLQKDNWLHLHMEQADVTATGFKVKDAVLLGYEEVKGRHYVTVAKATNRHANSEAIVYIKSYPYASKTKLAVRNSGLWNFIHPRGKAVQLERQGDAIPGFVAYEIKI